MSEREPARRGSLRWGTTTGTVLLGLAVAVWILGYYLGAAYNLATLGLLGAPVLVPILWWRAGRTGRHSVWADWDRFAVAQSSVWRASGT